MASTVIETERAARAEPVAFKFLLVLEDGEPNDPAAFLTAVPNWTVGETFSTARGAQWRILAIDSEIDDELVEGGFTAMFTVEPA